MGNAAFLGPTGLLGRAVRRVRVLLPEGHALPEQQWRARHRVILIVIWAHAAGLALFGITQGWGFTIPLAEGVALALMGGAAAIPGFPRRLRSGIASMALISCSAVLVQLWRGQIEGHFHFFVMLTIIALYQDWLPFLLGIAYVAIEHGVVGAVAPHLVYNHADGAAHPWRWAAVHATMVAGAAVANAALWRATERARAHAEQVLEASGEGILGLDPQGRITFANPAMAELTGLPERAMVGMSAQRFFRGALPKPVVTASDVRPRERMAADNYVVRSDAKLVPVELVATPILDHGEPAGSVIAVTDASNRKAAEREHARRLEQQSEIKRLKETDRFKTLFINTAAHELRTPLTPLKLHLHVLRSGKRGPLNDEQKRIAAILARNLDRLSQLVEDVLDVGRLQSGRLNVERTRVPLDRIVRDATESFQEVAKRSGVTLVCRAQKGLDVEGDARRLGQVVYNLLDNALKFTPPGGRIEAEAEMEGRHVVLRVRDTGAGLKAEDVERLFQPFTQINDPQRSRGGSGLGLYISKGIVELHGGIIECESEGPGKGAVFSVSVPAATTRISEPMVVTA